MADCLLYEVRNECITHARNLGDYQNLSITELADGYCAAIDLDDDYWQNAYLSALILRWWYRIDKLFEENKMILNATRDDAFDLLVEAINYAMKYRKWQTTTSSAQSCINTCINTIVLQHRYQARLHLHKANYNSMSLNTACNNEDDDEWIDTLAQEELATGEYDFDVKQLVQETIDQDKLIEAVILDTIAHKDNEAEETVTIAETDEDGKEEKYKAKRGKFSRLKLARNLSALDDSYLKYFTTSYIVKYAAAKKAIETLSKAKNPVLYEYLDNTLQFARANLVG